MVVALVLAVLISTVLLYSCSSLVGAIMFMALGGTLVIRFGVAMCRTITFCTDGIQVRILGLARFHKWEDLKSKCYFDCTNSFGYRSTYYFGAEFSPSASRRPQWLMPSEYAVFFHPWTYIFVYFAPENETGHKLKYPSLYEVEEDIFRTIMAEWTVLQ